MNDVPSAIVSVRRSSATLMISNLEKSHSDGFHVTDRRDLPADDGSEKDEQKKVID